MMTDEKHYTAHERVEDIDNSHPNSAKQDGTGSLVGVSANEEDSDVPKGYWASYEFLGSCVAIILLANSLFIGYAMPVRLLLSLLWSPSSADHSAGKYSERDQRGYRP